MLLPAVDTKDADDGIFLVVTCHTLNFQFLFSAKKQRGSCLVAGTSA